MYLSLSREKCLILSKLNLLRIRKFIVVLIYISIFWFFGFPLYLLIGNSELCCWLLYVLLLERWQLNSPKWLFVWHLAFRFRFIHCHLVYDSIILFFSWWLLIWFLWYLRWLNDLFGCFFHRRFFHRRFFHRRFSHRRFSVGWFVKLWFIEERRIILRSCCFFVSDILRHTLWFCAYTLYWRRFVVLTFWEWWISIFYPKPHWS
jgi:hypothetical protein